MFATLKELETAVLTLPRADLGTLVANMVAHLNRPIGDTPEAIPVAWQQRIERCAAVVDAGKFGFAVGTPCRRKPAESS